MAEKKTDVLFTDNDIESVEFVTSIMEVMATMAENDTIETGYIANLASKCSGKLKQLTEKIKIIAYKKY